MYYSPVTASLATEAPNLADTLPQQPLQITPVIHPAHGLASADSRTFWSATANAAYIVREDGEDLFGRTPGFADRLAVCPDLVAHGRRGPIGCDADAVTGMALWRAADEATVRDRPSSPAAWHVIGWLPTNTDASGWRALLLEFLDEQVVAAGMIADWAIHALRADGEESTTAGSWIKRPHFHAVLTSRFWKEGPRKGQPQPAWLTTAKRREMLVKVWAAISTR